MTDEEYSDDWPGVDEATEVIRAYERDSKLKPQDAQAHFDYGVAFMELGTRLEMNAIEAFKTAARLLPSWSAAHSQLGLAYASANRREEAVEAYRQALNLKPEDTDTLLSGARSRLFVTRSLRRIGAGTGRGT